MVGAAAVAGGREGADVAEGTTLAECMADPLECPLVRCGEAEGERGTMLLGTLVDASESSFGRLATGGDVGGEDGMTGRQAGRN